MDIHKPNAWPAWRVMLTDFVIVVLGVGVALAAQQMADWWRWKSDVAQAREVIASETALNLFNTILRIRSAPCIERRLDQVTDILDAAARTGSLPPVGNIGQAPALAWPRGAWDNVIASQTASHFPRQQLVNIARLYKAVERAESFNVMEREAWSTLYTMVGPGRRLDPASEAELRKALSTARLANRMILTTSAAFTTRTKAENLPYSRSDLDVIASAKRAPATGGNTGMADINGLALICAPIGAVPPRYGQSQNALYTTFYGEMVRGVPDFGDGAKMPAP